MTRMDKLKRKIIKVLPDDANELIGKLEKIEKVEENQVLICKKCGGDTWKISKGIHYLKCTKCGFTINHNWDDK